MSVVPKKFAERIAFYENHLGPWAANAAAIGTTAPIVTALQTKTQAARDALTAQEQAYQTAKTTTQALKDAVKAMSDAGAGVMDQIRGMAKNSGNPNVYTLAEIPAPPVPGPVGSPGTPYEPKTELDGDGSVILKWKCHNPAGASGTIYQIFRQIGGSGDFTYLGGVGEKKFPDSTIPAGATFVTYKIQAVRSTAVGMWATFNVQFGTNAGGAMTASVTSSADQQAPKLAA